MSAYDVQAGGSHYKHFKIQPAMFCHRNGLGFLESSIIKYASRYKFKWEDNFIKQIEDIEKAEHCLQLLKEEIKRNQNEQDTDRHHSPSLSAESAVIRTGGILLT